MAMESLQTSENAGKTGTFSEKQRAKILADLLEVQRLGGIPNADMARALLVSRSTWSQLCSGVYKAGPTRS